MDNTDLFLQCALVEASHTYMSYKLNHTSHIKYIFPEKKKTEIKYNKKITLDEHQNTKERRKYSL